ncbi:NepR family anti-sigma factor [Sphingorhabdus sp. Alg239-R122]|uniref:NepR family anti-sigma factor n=1 Tax=Sphingorhabdus sp. Alg239-R122 TaxID=2305989 RepID=UPI0013DBCA81|nr:NepR family anti-sigma factor [Sphingorhabdus sp. Alg239-R122]
MSHKFDNKNGQSKKAPRQVSGDESTCAKPSGDCDKSEVIGDALKTFYQNTLDEAVPDDFQDLLDKLN